MSRAPRIYVFMAVMILTVLTAIVLVAGHGAVSAAEAPVVKILSPQSGTIEDNTPLVSYTVSDSSAKVVVTLCGQVRNIESGQSLWILGPGTHTLRVEATNAQGLTGYDEVKFYIPCETCDTEPGGDHSDDPPGSGGGSGGTETPPTTLPPIKKTVSFSDVPSGAWFKRYVDMLALKGIIGGYPDETFRPNNHISRAEFAKMVCITKDWALPDTPSTSFSDVSTDHWACVYIENVRSNAVILGYPDGTYGPGKNITRAEIAAIVGRLLSLNPGASDFTDTASHWAQGYIGSCSSAGIISGYDDKTFKPDNPATRAEAAKMIAKMFDH